MVGRSAFAENLQIHGLFFIFLFLLFIEGTIPALLLLHSSHFRHFLPPPNSEGVSLALGFRSRLHVCEAVFIHANRFRVANDPNSEVVDNTESRTFVLVCDGHGCLGASAFSFFHFSISCF